MRGDIKKGKPKNNVNDTMRKLNQGLRSEGKLEKVSSSKPEVKEKPPVPESVPENVPVSSSEDNDNNKESISFDDAVIGTAVAQEEKEEEKVQISQKPRAKASKTSQKTGSPKRDREQKPKDVYEQRMQELGFYQQPIECYRKGLLLKLSSTAGSYLKVISITSGLPVKIMVERLFSNFAKLPAEEIEKYGRMDRKTNLKYSVSIRNSSDEIIICKKVCCIYGISLNNTFANFVDDYFSAFPPVEEL